MANLKGFISQYVLFFLIKHVHIRTYVHIYQYLTSYLVSILQLNICCIIIIAHIFEHR
ncbi:hypothetical protein MOSE0_F04236 [Monosporozyma servazzii]